MKLSKIHRKLVLAGTILVTVAGTAIVPAEKVSAVAATPAVGKACPKEGATTTLKNKSTLKCAKKGSKLLWAASAGSPVTTPTTQAVTATTQAAPTTKAPAAAITQAAFGQVLRRGEPTTGGTLNVPLESAVTSLDPFTGLTGGQIAASRLIFDTLLNIDEKGLVVGGLATSMRSTDNNVNWTMKLPTGVTFHDGTPFNAQAVVDHLTRIAAPGSRSTSAANIRRATSITAVDPTTIVFTLSSPWRPFGALFASGAPSWIPSPAAFAKYGLDIATRPVGTGPFMLDGSFTPNGKITLVRNPNYRVSGQPYLDKITLTTVTDEEARFAAVQSGDLDLMYTGSAQTFPRATSAGLTVLRSNANSYSNIVWNHARPPFNDPKFRLAVMQAIDLKGVNTAVFGGLNAPATGLFPTSNPYYVDTKWPTYDKAAATAAVKAYVAGGGNPSFTLTVGSPPDYQRTAAVIQQQLSDVGINAKLETGEQGPMISQGFSGEFQAQLRRGSVNPQTSINIENTFRGGVPGNLTREVNIYVDALLDRAAKTTSDGDLAGIYTDLQKELRVWLPMMPLIELGDGYVVGKKVCGFPAPSASTSVSAAEVDYRSVWLCK